MGIKGIAVASALAMGLACTAQEPPKQEESRQEIKIPLDKMYATMYGSMDFDFVTQQDLEGLAAQKDKYSVQRGVSLKDFCIEFTGDNMTDDDLAEGKMVIRAGVREQGMSKMYNKFLTETEIQAGKKLCMTGAYYSVTEYPKKN